MKKSMILVLFVINVFVTSAQNNLIFQGGPGDGINKISFAQAGGNIFSGGSGDGFNKVVFSQPGVNIFNGGTGDGWNKNGYAQTPVNIFNGGTGDGWNNRSFLQAGNAIFSGGIGDGWNSTLFLQPGNAIFTGGEGDGWSSTYRPMGPLPVIFNRFTARKKNERSALLNWQTSQEINSAYFEIERSSDAVQFIKIGRTTAAGSSSLAIDYYFTDDEPLKGFNYYRLKQVDVDGHFEYTAARVVKFDNPAEESIKFYPNPTSGLITMKLPENATWESLLVNIINVAGEVVNQLRPGIPAGNVISLDLSGYPKGSYFIQVKTATINTTQRVVLQ